MRVILVTGAGGYLGAEILAALHRAGIKATGIARRPANGLEICDLLDADGTTRLIERLKPDRIIHCAWETPQSLSQYADDAAGERGLAMLDTLLAASQAPIIQISSMTVYGSENNTIVRRESDAGQPESAYGAAKWKAEQRLSANRRAGFAVRLPGLFGGGRQSGLVYNTLRALVRGDAPELPAQPLLWAAMDVRDAAQSLTQLASAPIGVDFSPVNIGYADVYSISRLMTLLGELTGYLVPCNAVHPDFAFNLSQAQKLGVAPQQNLRGACARLLKEMA